MIILNQRRRDHTKNMHLVFDPPPFGITFHFLATLNFIYGP